MLMLKCAPEPHAPVYGFGMNDATSPQLLATCCAMSRKNVILSAISSAGLYSKSNSYCASPPSASKLNTPNPVSFMYLTIGSRNVDRVHLGLDVVRLRRLQTARPRHRFEVAVGAPEGVLTEHVQLGLDAEVEQEAFRGGDVELALQDRTGAVRERLGAAEQQVGRHPREPAVPRHHAQRRRVGHGDALVLVGRHPAQVAHPAGVYRSWPASRCGQVRRPARPSTSRDRGRRRTSRPRTPRPASARVRASASCSAVCGRTVSNGSPRFLVLDGSRCWAVVVGRRA